MIESHVTIVNRAGLHLRAATSLVSLTQGYLSDVFLRVGDFQADAKSILSVLMLGLGVGSRVRLLVYGEDEEKAHRALQSFFEEGFGEGT